LRYSDRAAGWVSPRVTQSGETNFLSSKIFRTASGTHADLQVSGVPANFPWGNLTGTWSYQFRNVYSYTSATPRLHATDSLWTGGPGNRIPVLEVFSALDQTGPWAHAASYTMVSRSFQLVKRPRR